MTFGFCSSYNKENVPVNLACNFKNHDCSRSCGGGHLETIEELVNRKIFGSCFFCPFKVFIPSIKRASWNDSIRREEKISRLEIYSQIKFAVYNDKKSLKKCRI